VGEVLGFFVEVRGILQCVRDAERPNMRWLEYMYADRGTLGMVQRVTDGEYL
jgi:hypothetical protein